MNLPRPREIASRYLGIALPPGVCLLAAGGCTEQGNQLTDFALDFARNLLAAWLF
jgi:hypothetical protein